MVESFIVTNHFKMKSLLLSLVALMLLAAGVFGQHDKTLLEIAKKGFEARTSAGGILNKEASIPAFRKPFEGLDDSQKIKAIALYLNDIDQSDLKLSMSASSPVDAVDALRDDPNFIHDWSSLGPMLEHELDSRKFFLLSNLVPWTKEAPPHGFIAERAHMLFADGRVTKREGEYTREYAGDVSKYAYVAITGKLRVLGAGFIPPAKNLRHEEQIVILVKWLRENWPGCEKLGEGEILMAESGIESKELLPPVDPPKKELPAKVNVEPPAESTARKSWWLTITIGITALVIFIVRLNRRS